MKKVNILVILIMLFFYSGCNSSKNDVVNIVLGEVSGNVQTQITAYINQARNEARNCGSEGNFSAVLEVSWDYQLETAAENHSQDMLNSGSFNHTGSDGSSVGIRATDEGYAWSAISENIYKGFDTSVSAKHVVESWMNSAGHCANIMGSSYEDIGLGIDGEYWTLVLGKKKL